MDGLALAVQEVMGLDPFCGAAFVSRAKRADRIKIVIWDRTGMVFGAVLEPVAHAPLTPQAPGERRVRVAALANVSRTTGVPLARQNGVMRMSPAQLRVLVTRRPGYACRRCSGAVMQAHAPEHVVPGGLPTLAIVARTNGAKMARR